MESGATGGSSLRHGREKPKKIGGSVTRFDCFYSSDQRFYGLGCKNLCVNLMRNVRQDG